MVEPRAVSLSITSGVKPPISPKDWITKLATPRRLLRHRHEHHHHGPARRLVDEICIADRGSNE